MSVSKKFTALPPPSRYVPPIQGKKTTLPQIPVCGLADIEETSLKKNKNELLYIYIYILGLIEKNRAKFRGVVILFFLSFIFLTMREKYRRASILDPHQEKERSLEGSVGVVTGCHAGSLEGQRHPEELSQLVGHLPTSYGGGLLAVVFAIHL